MPSSSCISFNLCHHHSTVPCMHCSFFSVVSRRLCVTEASRWSCNHCMVWRHSFSARKQSRIVADALAIAHLESGLLCSGCCGFWLPRAHSRMMLCRHWWLKCDASFVDIVCRTKRFWWPYVIRSLKLFRTISLNVYRKIYYRILFHVEIWCWCDDFILIDQEKLIPTSKHRLQNQDVNFAFLFILLPLYFICKHRVQKQDVWD